MRPNGTGINTVPKHPWIHITYHQPNNVYLAETFSIFWTTSKSYRINILGGVRIYTWRRWRPEVKMK